MTLKFELGRDLTQQTVTFWVFGPRGGAYDS